MATWNDFIGTVKGYIRIGFTGPRLKNASGHLAVRNPADSADAELITSKLKVSGDVMELNSDAGAAGADWKYTLQRPATGMSAAVVLTMPVNDGSPNQVLRTDGSGLLDWADAADTSAADKIDTTSLAFGAGSPLAMFTLPANALVEEVEIIIDTSFDDVPSVSIGISGTVSKYVAATDVDLLAAPGTIFKICPGLVPVGTTEALIATYSAAAASVGAARILVHYAIPS